MGDPSDQAPVRDRIMHEATKLFAERGYARTTTAAIVKAAGITKPMLYYYFGDKAGLFKTVIQEMNQRLLEGIAEIEEKDLPASEKLIEMAECILAQARKEPYLSRLRFASYFGPPEEIPREALEELGFRTFAALLQTAMAGIEAGELQGHPGDIASAVYGTVNLYVMAHLARPREMTLPPGTGRKIVDLLLNGIRRR